MRGADRLIEALEREGADCIFGLPGGASLAIHDALHDSAIRHVLVRHEAGAGHAAEGYAKASGRVGVALVTSGPGATNLATPIADAHMDSVPTVFLCAQVRSDLRGTNAFQETDVLGMTLPISKHSIAVERPDDVADAIHEAFHVARTGRPGPVVVDIPSDHARAPARAGSDALSLPGYRTRVVPNGRQLRAAAQAIADARRPVLYAGGGVVHAEAAVELAALARLADLPVTTTLMALGAYPASDHRWLGMLGMHGTRTANWAMDEADLIIAVGARFDDRVTGDLASFAQRARVVHIDVDAAEIGKNVAAHIPVVGDARQALEALREHLVALAPDPERLAPWWRRIVAWRGEHPPREAAHPEGGVDAEAALGAQAAFPAAQVVCVTGDGSLLMNVAELATAAEEDLPVKVLLLDNQALGMVRQQQDMFWGGRRAASALGGALDWELVARGFGVAARSVTDGDELDEALDETLAEDGPALLHVAIERDADCLPMFRPGGSARDMIG
jgi:acetolactate synthase-1/2/3 large subunit